MRYILIDDSIGNLEQLLEAVSGTASSIEAIWANTGDLEGSRLLASQEKFRTQERAVEVYQAKSQAELAELIKTLTCDPIPSVLCSDSAIRSGTCDPIPSILCSDLTMSDTSIGITSFKSGEGWHDPENSVVLAIRGFSMCRGHLVCLHSGTGGSSTVAEKMGGPAAKIYDLVTNFETGGAEEIAAKISQITANFDKTPLEKFWANESAMYWFSSHHYVKHNYKKIDKMESYKQEINDVFCECMPADFPTIPQQWWTEDFHESLKGVMGADFCGTDTALDSSISRNKRLLLGGVVLIAALAYGFERKCFGQFENIWKNVENIWKRKDKEEDEKILNAITWRFLSDKEPSNTRRVALELWSFFRIVFASDKHEGNVKNIHVLEDGIDIKFSWKTKELFNEAKELIKESKSAEYLDPTSNDYSAKNALTSVIISLAFEPGRVLPSRRGIRIQAVND
jgi:hypothetical protein